MKNARPERDAELKENFMELNFEKSTIGVAETAFTPEGVKITLVQRTKSLIIVYYGQELIAECKNREQALSAIKKREEENIKCI